jgi:hypothetical protein
MSSLRPANILSHVVHTQEASVTSKLFGKSSAGKQTGAQLPQTRRLQFRQCSALAYVPKTILQCIHHERDGAHFNGRFTDARIL